MKSPIVSVVVGSYNRLPYLKAMLETVRAELIDVPHEIIIVDGGSTDGTMRWLIEQKDVISIFQHNRGEWQGKPIERRSWSYFMNLGFKAASGTYICMLSDDCLVIPGAIVSSIKEFDRMQADKKKVGAIAFYWRNWPEQNNYWVGKTWGDKFFVNHGLYFRKAMQQIGFADEENYSFYHADGDICMRLDEAGYPTAAASNSYIEHYSDANTKVRASNSAGQQADWATYTKRWSKLGVPSEDWVTKDFHDSHDTANKYWSRLALLASRFTK